MKKNDIDYKKLTIEIPYTTFLQMKNYCMAYTNGKKIYYRDFIKFAIEYYIKNHS